MKINTNLRRLDHIHLTIVLVPRLLSTYVTIGIIALAILFFLLWQNSEPETTRNWILMVVLSLGGGVGGILVGTFISLISILTTATENNGILGLHEYEITSEGLFEKTHANEGLYKWSGIQEICKVRSFLLFKISGDLFHVIPMRAFESEQEFYEYMEKAMDEWQDAT